LKYPIRIGPSTFLLNAFIGYNLFMLGTAVLALWYSSRSGPQFVSAVRLYGLFVLPAFALFLFIIFRARKTIGLLVYEHEARVGELVVPWGEISEAFIGSTVQRSSALPQVFLCFSLRGAEQFWLRNPDLQKAFERITRTSAGLGLPAADIYVLLNAAKQSPEEALEIVRARIKAYS